MSGMQWFRLYNRIVDDEKLRLLAFEDRWHFVAICSLRSSGLLNEPDGPLRNRKIAVKMGVQVRELEEITRRLREVDLVDEHLNPIAWDELQYRSDNSTERVKKYREKQQRNSEKRSGNVSVTGQETDTETEVSPNGDSSAKADAPTILNELREAWNASAASQGAVACNPLSSSRRRKLAPLLKRRSVDDITEAIFAVGRSKFLTGRTKEQFRASITFLCSEEHFDKLLEGFYA